MELYFVDLEPVLNQINCDLSLDTVVCLYVKGTGTVRFLCSDLIVENCRTY